MMTFNKTSCISKVNNREIAIISIVFIELKLNTATIDYCPNEHKAHSVSLHKFKSELLIELAGL